MGSILRVLWHLPVLRHGSHLTLPPCCEAALSVAAQLGMDLPPCNTVKLGIGHRTG